MPGTMYAATEGLQPKPDLAFFGAHVFAQQTDGLVGPVQHALRERQEELAVGGELDAPAFAVEQSGAQLSFEILHLVAEGRLRNVQDFCGGGEAHRLGDGDEVAKLGKFHGSIMVFDNSYRNNILELWSGWGYTASG